MNPVTLFPWLALLFAGLGLWSWVRQRAFKGSARTWCLMAVIFGAVAVWLRWQG